MSESLCVCWCHIYVLCCFFFKQKTAYEIRISDWSSDVCSSDLDLGVSGRDGDRAGSGDGGLVGAEVGLDDAGVVEDLGGRALGDDGAELERHHAVAAERKSVV